MKGGHVMPLDDINKGFDTDVFGREHQLGQRGGLTA
jgi:hypothetical protein